MWGVECTCRKGDKTPGAILRRVFKNKMAQPPCKAWVPAVPGGLGWDGKDLEPSPGDPVQANTPTIAANPLGNRSVHLHTPTPSPKMHLPPQKPSRTARRASRNEASPVSQGAAKLCLHPMDLQHNPSSRWPGFGPMPSSWDTFYHPTPPPRHTKCFWRGPCRQPRSPVARGSALACSSSACREIVWFLYSFFLFFFSSQFNIYSFAPLAVCSAESKGEDGWRRDGFFKGSHQHRLDRTRAGIGAGIAPVAPGFLSNVPPPANTWVYWESEEQELKLILGLDLLHPWPDHPTCVQIRLENPSADPAAGQDLATHTGNHRGSSGHTSGGGEKMSTYFLPASSRRDHPFHPSKRCTASAIPCFSCEGDNDGSSPRELRAGGGCSPAASAPGLHHGSAKPELLPPPALRR